MAPERDTPAAIEPAAGRERGRPGYTVMPPLGRESALLDEDDDRADRSNITAFFLGGVMLVGGLLAFLYYDGTGNENDLPFTASLAPIEAPARPGLSLQPPPPAPRP